MSSTRPRSPSSPDRDTAVRLILYVFLVLFMGNVGAMVDRFLHPGIRYFDQEHLIVGGITALAMVLLLGALETYLGRQKKIEGMRRRSEERHRAIFDLAAEGIMILSPDGKLIDVNESFARMHGYSVGELLQMNINDLDGPETARLIPERMRRLLAGESLSFDVEHHHKDGHVFPLEVTANRVSIGGESCIQCFHRDITERKRAEEALRSSNDTLRALVNSSPLSIVTFDKDGNIGMWNSAAERMFGWRAEEVMGRPHPIVPEDKQEEFLQLRKGALGGESFTGKELRRIRKDGSYIDISVSTAPLRDAAGSITSVLSIITDITDRKRAETEKKKLQDQLQQAMKMEAVGRLAGGIAHDFNNLMMVVTGYSELLLQKVGRGSPLRGDVEEIKRAGERASELTQQLLAFSRKQIIEPKVMDLNELIAGMETMLVRLIGENIELRIVPGVGLGFVKVDPGQIEQILMNLAVNARDAMPDGGRLLIETANADLDADYCTRHSDSSPGPFVMLSVADTGHGMDEETMELIFEPFFTTKPKGSGTGLGLSTLYGAVKQSGGSVEVSSGAGRGATFKIFLPRLGVEAVTPVKDDRPTDLPGGTETVLLVEDEDSVRDLGVQILERLGYKVLRGSSGTEATALAQQYSERIDLLLTDVVMPGMNGAELAMQLVLHHPEMKVLFTSGYTDDAIARHGILEDGVSFIGKPYCLSDLARKVREVLGRA